MSVSLGCQIVILGWDDISEVLQFFSCVGGCVMLGCSYDFCLEGSAAGAMSVGCCQDFFLACLV